MTTPTRTLTSALTGLFLSLACVASEPPWDDGVSVGGQQPLPSGLLPKPQLDALIEQGEALFIQKFDKASGAGRPGATQAIIPTKQRHRSEQQFARLAGPDAQACASCHNDPVVGLSLIHI